MDVTLTGDDITSVSRKYTESTSTANIFTILYNTTPKNYTLKVNVPDSLNGVAEAVFSNGLSTVTFNNQVNSELVKSLKVICKPINGNAPSITVPIEVKFTNYPTSQ
jgi:hypothetical protein